MKAKLKKRPSSRISGAYLNLVMEFPLVSLKTEREFRAAQGMIDRLVKKEKLERGEEIYLDALSDLFAAYEDVHYPIAAASDADMLRGLMEEKGIDQEELHRQTNIANKALADVLAGKKGFDCRMIPTLADYFQVKPSVLSSNQ